MSCLCEHAVVCFAFATGSKKSSRLQACLLNYLSRPKTPCSVEVDKCSRLEFRMNSEENHQTNHVYRPEGPDSSHSCGQELLKTLKKDVGVLLLEDQHRPKADGLSS
jgi:hypothetical protein